MAFGYFDPARMAADYRLAKASYKDMKDFSVQEFFSNDFLDRSYKTK